MDLFQEKCLWRKGTQSFCWLFNIGIEDRWFADRFKIRNEAEETVVGHMEEIMLLLAGSEDIVLLRKRPHADFLRKINKLGFQIPKIFCPEKEDLSRTITELVLEDTNLIGKLRGYADMKEIVLMPYGVTEVEEQLGNVCSMKVNGSSAVISKRTNNKLYAKELIQKLALPHPEGVVCAHLEEIPDAWNRLHRTFEKIVIKRPYGASGQGLYRIESNRQLERILYALRRSQKEEEGWIVEGWYEERQDLNAQLYLHEDGTVEIFSIKEQLLKDTVYRGSLFPVSLPDKIMSEYEESLKKLGEELYRDGVRGIVGIDSILTKQGVFPVIDINVRFTLSTYLSSIPVLFADRCFMSMYYRVPLTEKIGYEALERRVVKEGIAFDPDKKEGVFFYNRACMEENIVGGLGRLFVILSARDREALTELHLKLNKILEEDAIQV